MEHKYAVKEELLEGKQEVIVKEHIPFSPGWHHCPMYLVHYKNTQVDLIMEEIWLKRKPIICDCGAQHTTKPNDHWDWCSTNKYDRIKK
jgi:aromatic ring-cleaving dioxygenase